MAQQDPPYSLDFFQTIVDVHFEEGLAVEFGDQDDGPIGFLVLPSLPDFSKAAMAFWFRVPADRLQATADSWIAPTREDPKPQMFNGITPLVIFGNDRINGYKIDASNTTVQTVASEIWTKNLDNSFYLRDDSTPGTFNAVIDEYSKGDDILQEPCYIGIDSNREEFEGYDPEGDDPPPTKNVLVVKLQMSSKPSRAVGMIAARKDQSVSGDQIFYQQQSGDSSGGFRGSGTISTFGPDHTGASTFGIDAYNPFVVTTEYEDKTAFYMESITESFTIKLDNKEITPDRWHCVIISPDLSGTVTAFGFQLPDVYSDPNDFPDHGEIKSTCKAWVSLDDVNYKGANIRDKLQFTERVTSSLTFEPNAIYTPNAIQVALTRQPANGTADRTLDGLYRLDNVSGLSLPEYDYSPGKIPANDYPMGIPATAKYSDKIREVEMGEFFMWTGKTVDTSSKKMRRLFVDDKGKPVPPTVATKKLGTPTIAFHGSKNWIKGKNTGRLKKNFTPHMRITKYKPDPSLHGPQSPSDLKR